MTGKHWLAWCQNGREGEMGEKREEDREIKTEKKRDGEIERQIDREGETARERLKEGGTEIESIGSDISIKSLKRKT
jgi:hypothetical protein